MTAETPRGDEGEALAAVVAMTERGLPMDDRQALIALLRGLAEAYPGDFASGADALTRAGFTRAPQDDRAAQVRALREAADQLPAMTEGECRGGTEHWTSERDRDTYSLAIEEAQAALRARADALAASLVAQGERGQG